MQIKDRDGSKKLVAWGTYIVKTWQHKDRMFMLDMQSMTWKAFDNPNHPGELRHGFPYANGIFAMNSLEYTLINSKGGGGSSMWQWDLIEERFQTIHNYDIDPDTERVAKK